LTLQTLPLQEADSHKQFALERPEIAHFLHEHLEEYGDSLADIERCLDYAASSAEGKGGSIVLAKDGDTITGAVVFNDTGMQGYIPEHMLVYIAVHRDYRGQGLGKKLLAKALKTVPGSIALHVEADNPARYLYEKLGFETKYLEMRLGR
jgi:GNAT superfamily N-acetyltransferase